LKLSKSLENSFIKNYKIHIIKKIGKKYYER